MYTRIEDVRAWSGGSNAVVGEGRSLLEVSGLAWGLCGGVFYRTRRERLRFGASYQSRPNVAGGMRLAGRLSNDIGGPSSADVELHEDLPDVLRVGDRPIAFGPTWSCGCSAIGSAGARFSGQCVTQAGAELRASAQRRPARRRSACCRTCPAIFRTRSRRAWAPASGPRAGWSYFRAWA